MIDVEFVNPNEGQCGECGCSFQVHLVSCSHFHCHNCGQNGTSPDHYGGCPNQERMGAEGREARAARFIIASGKSVHASDCSTSPAPAEEPGPCDCHMPRMNETQKMRGRPVTHAEARAAALRLIHSHFHQPDGARCTIPRDPMDDDILICDYIDEQEAAND